MKASKRWRNWVFYAGQKASIDASIWRFGIGVEGVSSRYYCLYLGWWLAWVRRA